jgi:GAF domain-containing protein
MFDSIKAIFTPPSFEDEDKGRVAFYLNAITLSTVVLLTLLLTIRLVQGVEAVFSPANIVLISLIFLLFVTRFLMKKGNVQLASHILIGFAWVGLTYLSWEADGIRDSTFVAFFVIIIMSSLLLGSRAMIFYSAISIIAGFGLAYLETSGTIQPRLDTPENYARDLAFFFSLGSIFLYLLSSSLNNTLNQARATAQDFQANNKELQILQYDQEKRVAERTSELEAANQQSHRRASQFEAVAQVARNISTSQNLDTLLPNITKVISERFGFYHVGIFLLSDNREFAVLRAANSPGGREMLERAHQLKVGEIGIVGFVTSEGKPRIALDTSTDAVYFDNPDLPDTRSEMALPLIASNQVIGALDVQSLESNAFSQEDISTLTTLADQVSIAIQNAQLFEETRHALAQSQALYQQFTQAGWKKYTRTQKLTGIRRSNANSTLLKDSLPTDDLNGKSTLNLPITLRDQKIGSLKIRAADNRQWTQDEVDIASAIIERSAIALDSARLLDDAQRRASREHIIGEISASVGSSTDMEEIMRSAVQELGRKMGGAEVELELGTNIDKNTEHKDSVQP